MTSHYEVEDVPAETVETQLALYQESRAMVVGGSDLAVRLLGETGPILETLYDNANAANDTEAMAAVNLIWAKTQELSGLVGKSSAALNGADHVIDVLKESRASVLNELNTIVNGLKESDLNAHPLLEQFREEIEQQVIEWEAYNDPYYDHEFDLDEITDHIFENVEPLLDGVGFIYRREVVANLVNILMGEDAWNDAQEVLLRELFKSLAPTANRSAIEDAEDFEDDEDGE